MVVNLDTRDVVNPRNIQGFLNALPANVNDLPILIVRRESAQNTYSDFKIECSLLSFGSKKITNVTMINSNQTS